MARTTLTKTIAPGSYAAAGTVVTETAADVANKNQFVPTGTELLLIRNSGASPHTYTITSIADPYGRVKDITAQSIAAGALHTFGPMALTGWVQSDGFIYIEANHAEVMFSVVKLPG